MHNQYYGVQSNEVWMLACIQLAVCHDESSLKLQASTPELPGMYDIRREQLVNLGYIHTGVLYIHA